MFHWYEDYGSTASTFGLRWGFTDRTPALGSGPWRGFDLGFSSGGDQADVAEHRRLLEGALGLDAGRLVTGTQVHGAGVHRVDEVPAAPLEGDALVTGSTDLAVAVIVADCTPVLLADRTAGLVAAAHAGRQGMLAGVVPAAVAALRAEGATAIEAVVGPSICPRCYEVPEPMRAAAAAVEPVTASVTRWGTPAVDVAAGVVEQLRREGVPTRWLPGCTFEDERFYSYRRDQVTGRMLGVVRLTPRAGHR